MLGWTRSGSIARERLETGRPVHTQEFGERQYHRKPTDPTSSGSVARKRVAASTDPAQDRDKFAGGGMQGAARTPRMVGSRPLVAFGFSCGNVDRIRRRAAYARIVGTGGSPAHPKKGFARKSHVIGLARSLRTASLSRVSSITLPAPEAGDEHMSRYRQASGGRSAAWSGDVAPANTH
jgi:hypothetical protein